LVPLREIRELLEELQVFDTIEGSRALDEGERLKKVEIVSREMLSFGGG
jgi:hypothetical protein